MTPSGIEPVTFRLVAQCLNQLLLKCFKKWPSLNENLILPIRHCIDIHTFKKNIENFMHVL